MIGRSKFVLTKLVNEMLDQFPASTWTSDTITFCDFRMGGGQFLVEVIRRLREADHSDKNIAGRVFGYEANLLLIGYAINTHELIGTFEVRTLEEIQNMSMKFDVIVGNPPYQENNQIVSNNGANKLWTKFIKLALTSCVPNGYVAFITPQSWMAPNKAFDLMTAQKLIYVNTKIKHHFPTIGSDFSAWIMKNIKNDGPIPIDGQRIDVKVLGLVPKDRSNEGLSILTKFLSHNSKIKFHVVYGKCGSKERKKNPNLFSKEKSAKYKFEILMTSSQTHWSSIPAPAQGMKKVVIYDSGYLTPTYNETSGTGSHAFYKLVNSKQEGKNLVDLLNSKLFSYVFEITKYGGFFLATLFDKLPYIDYSRPWTAPQIYEHFGITKKEQEHIESYIK